MIDEYESKRIAEAEAKAVRIAETRQRWKASEVTRVAVAVHGVM